MTTAIFSSFPLGLSGNFSLFLMLLECSFGVILGSPQDCSSSACGERTCISFLQNKLYFSL